jgi:hypothetical protein
MKPERHLAAGEALPVLPRNIALDEAMVGGFAPVADGDGLSLQGLAGEGLQGHWVKGDRRQRILLHMVRQRLQDLPFVDSAVALVEDLQAHDIGEPAALDLERAGEIGHGPGDLRLQIAAMPDHAPGIEVAGTADEGQAACRPRQKLPAGDRPFPVGARHCRSSARLFALPI